MSTFFSQLLLGLQRLLDDDSRNIRLRCLPKCLEEDLSTTMGLPLIPSQRQSRAWWKWLNQVQGETSFHLTPDTPTSIQLPLPPPLVSNTTDGNVWMGRWRNAGPSTSFLRTTVYRSYRDQFYSSLTSEIVESVIRHLSRQVCGLMVLDNFQRGNQWRDQRGGRSSKFLIGTTEAAHRVFPFLDFRWDQRKIEMTYCKQQIIPSPLGMWSYETINMTSPSLGTNLFTTHLQIPISHEPCFSGELVKVYKNAIRLRRYILAIRSSLSHEYKNDVHNEPPSKIVMLRDYVRQRTAAAFFNDVLKFQRQAVQDWNSHCEENSMAEFSPWSRYLNEIRPNYYL